MTAFQKAAPQQNVALAGHYYTSADIFRQEIQRIFSNHWLCVGRSEQIPDTGDYFLAEVGGENLIILRSAGVARAFFNVCRHRGTRLCTQNQGHLGEQIQCPYHAWTYSLEGQLQATRQMQHDRFAAKDYPLYACALHEWEGFLWVNLATNPAPFAQTFAPLLNRFAPWQMASLRRSTACGMAETTGLCPTTQQITYTVNANWKLIFQNYLECYHRPTVRPKVTRLASPSNLREGTFLSGYQTLNDRSARTVLPGIQGDCDIAPQPLRDRAYYYSLFPTMLLSLHPDYVVTHRLLPLSPDQTQIQCEWLFDADAIAQPDFDVSEAIKFWELSDRQNWRRCESAQQSVDPARAAAQYPAFHGCEKGSTAAFNQEYLRVMGA